MLLAPRWHDAPKLIEYLPTELIMSCVVWGRGDLDQISQAFQESTEEKQIRYTYLRKNIPNNDIVALQRLFAVSIDVHRFLVRLMQENVQKIQLTMFSGEKNSEVASSKKTIEIIA